MDENKSETKKENKKPKPHISIDSKTGLKQITCQTKKLFKHPDDHYGILQNGSIRVIINGKSGTGKSHLLRILIPMMCKPTHIFICTTVVGSDVHEGIRKYCKKEGIKYHFHLVPDEFLDEMSEVVQKKNEDEHIICIFDDFSDNHTTKDNVYHNTTIRAFSKWRNYNVSCIIISPDCLDIKSNIVNSCNIRILFPIDNPYGAQEFKKYIKTKYPKINPEYWQKLYDHICKNEYNFILCSDTNEGKKYPHIRLNWDKIVYPTDEIAIEGVDKIEPEEEVKKDGRFNNKKASIGLIRRHELAHKAVDLGLPQYFYTSMTEAQLEKFINYQKKRGGKYEGSADLLFKIVGEKRLPKEQLLKKFYKAIEMYEKTEKNVYWVSINSLGKDLINLGYIDKHILGDILKKRGIIDSDED
jgi:hypothetical protein